MGRAPCCDKANVKKGPWSPEEDAKLKAYIEQNGTGGNWISLPQKIGLKRCGKSCRLRWLNYLRPNIKHGDFSEEEDNIICSLYTSIGSRWSIIAAQLPGRTDNDIKNYWNTRLKKKLLGKQAWPATPRQEIGMNHNTSCWTELPVVTNPNFHDQYSYFLNQESLKSLLIKLGGRFSDENNQESHAITNPMNSNMFSSSSTNSADRPCSQLPNYVNFIVNGSSSTSIFQETSGFPVEINELLVCNNIQHGFESFHAMGQMADNGIRNCSSLQGYPQLVSEFETCIQNLPQDHSSFQVSSSLGHNNIELLYI